MKRGDENLAQLAARAAQFVVVDDDGSGWCDVHIMTAGRDYGPQSDHAPQSVCLERSHPVAVFLTQICTAYRRDAGHG